MSVESCKLSRRVLIDEFVDGKVTSANLDRDFSTVNLDTDTTGSKLIDALRLSHEHDLELLLVRIVVDVFSQLRVNRVSLHWYVDRNSLLDVDELFILDEILLL